MNRLRRARAQAEELARELSAERHHRVVCPACGCTATLQGMPFGKEHVTHEEAEAIVVRQVVSPTDFSCSACGLKLTTYAAVETAGLGEHYTRTTTYSLFSLDHAAPSCFCRLGRTVDQSKQPSGRVAGIPPMCVDRSVPPCHPLGTSMELA